MDGSSLQRKSAHYLNLERFLNTIWEKEALCAHRTVLDLRVLLVKMEAKTKELRLYCIFVHRSNKEMTAFQEIHCCLCCVPLWGHARFSNRYEVYTLAFYKYPYYFKYVMWFIGRFMGPACQNKLADNCFSLPQKLVRQHGQRYCQHG